MAKKRSAAARYDIDYVRQAVRGRAAELLSRLGGLSPDILDGRHHPCPKCGGTDRFRLVDADAGAVLCNQCFRTGNGDVLAAIGWATNRKFADVLASVADYLGIAPSAAGSHKTNGHVRELADPAEHLNFQDWDESTELLAATWCLTKRPITVAAIRASGGRVARYRQQYTVIALPVWGERLNRDGVKPVGWCLYNITGGPLPKFVKQPAGQPAKVEWVKVKLTYGSQPGVISDLVRLKEAKEIWKVEGPSDLMAALSVAGMPPDVAIITNASGAQENPPAWIPPLFAGRVARVLHDADKPGQDGSLGWTDPKLGRPHVGWAQAIATMAAECRNVTLPYPLSPDHGKDLRDWLNEQPRTWSDLQALAESAEIVLAEQPGGAGALKPLEAEDDPHRLARVNLDRYAAQADGATIRYWRSEWYTWKPSRGCYKQISEDELRAKLAESIKQEFDRINVLEQQSSDSDELPTTRKVTKTLVNNVLAATASLTCIPSSVEAMTWLDCDGTRERRNYVAMLNGVIDLDKLLADADESECILPNSPKWFSTVRLPYEFNPDAECPRWLAFLHKNLERDEQRIARLQEWSGYCLLPDTGQQKFLAMEGEGANGKSVYCAALSAMLGAENCSHVTLERFGERFEKTATLGKLVNICADVGEIDRVAEGCLKSFTSGDTMYFDRKHVSGVSCIPTARLVLCFNNRPRLSDRSGGIWRRTLLVPWFYQITEAERIPNMDKPWWWEQSGELPGIFLWALQGLHRLRQQGKFTASEKGDEALEDYRDESNPVRSFLKENFELSDSSIRCSVVYHFYCKWCVQTGHKPMSDAVFGREVKRAFGTKRERVRFGGELRWNYRGIAFISDQLFGEKTSGDTLF